MNISKYFDIIKYQYAEILKICEELEFDDKSVIIVDIDETVLCNLCSIPCVSEFFHKSIMPTSCNNLCPLIPTSYSFVQELNKFAPIIFVTGRREFIREETVLNLQLFDYIVLYMCPVSHKGSMKEFKTDVRKNISTEYNIVLNIGDQESDLGEYANNNYKMCNFTYSIS
jgi:predicted secreted acid phosphatase